MPNNSLSNLNSIKLQINQLIEKANNINNIDKLRTIIATIQKAYNNYNIIETNIINPFSFGYIDHNIIVYYDRYPQELYPFFFSTPIESIIIEHTLPTYTLLKSAVVLNIDISRDIATLGWAQRGP